MVQQGHNEPVRMARPAALINQDLRSVRFRQKCNRKLSTLKLSVLFAHEDAFWKMSLLLIPAMGFHPTDTANSIAGRCTKVPKQMGECHYLLFQ